MFVYQATEEFLTWVSANRAPKTHRAYGQRLRAFTAQFGHRALSRLTSREIDRFVSDCRSDENGKGYAQDTVRLTISVFEQFQKWAVAAKLLKRPIVPPIKKPKGRRRERVPTGEEQFAILQHATRQFRLIFLGLRLSGARPIELISANLSDWDRHMGLIVLDDHKTANRTSRRRRIGVGHKLRSILEESTADRTHGPLFLDENALRWRTGQLSARYRRYRDKAGLSRELVLYSATRHEHGMRVTRQLGIHAAAHSLGHSSIETTMRYAHPDDRDLGSYQDRVFDF